MLFILFALIHFSLATEKIVLLNLANDWRYESFIGFVKENFVTILYSREGLMVSNNSEVKNFLQQNIKIANRYFPLNEAECPLVKTIRESFGKKLIIVTDIDKEKYSTHENTIIMPVGFFGPNVADVKDILDMIINDKDGDVRFYINQRKVLLVNWKDIMRFSNSSPVIHSRGRALVKTMKNYSILIILVCKNILLKYRKEMVLMVKQLGIDVRPEPMLYHSSNVYDSKNKYYEEIVNKFGLRNLIIFDSSNISPFNNNIIEKSKYSYVVLDLILFKLFLNMNADVRSVLKYQVDIHIELQSSERLETNINMI